jgi:organic hydroperoxide reductase OsmC/OhrA
MGILHTYTVDVTWTGAGTTGTTSYRAYSRDHEVRLDGKPPLHLASDAGVVVVAYSDAATATMRVEAHGAGQFTEVVLHPVVTVSGVGAAVDGTADGHLMALHRRAHEYCFISRSVSVPVRIDPSPVRVTTSTIT